MGSHHHHPGPTETSGLTVTRVHHDSLTQGRFPALNADCALRAHPARPRPLAAMGSVTGSLVGLVGFLLSPHVRLSPKVTERVTQHVAFSDGLLSLDDIQLRLLPVSSRPHSSFSSFIQTSGRGAVRRVAMFAEGTPASPPTRAISLQLGAEFRHLLFALAPCSMADPRHSPTCCSSKCTSAPSASASPSPRPPPLAVSAGSAFLDPPHR